MGNVERIVFRYRKVNDRRAGSRSTYYNIDIKNRFGIGVNKFERLLSEHELTMAPLRVNVVTTNSSFQSFNYENLVEGLVINGIRQLIVGDLTYVAIGKYRYFLFCLTDVYSSRIVGYHLNSRMRAIDALMALNMLVSISPLQSLKGCIHHTDGGSQYFSKMYLKVLQEHEMKISVAKICLENGYAEQMNGYIKHHLVPTVKSSSGVGLTKEINRIFKFYNYERKQKKLGWLSPIEFESSIIESGSCKPLVIYKPTNKK